MKNNLICKYLDKLYPDPICPLNYNKDYELLIATVLSAQTTDIQVNKVTSELFKNRTIYDIANINKEELIEIIKPCGNMTKKSEYIIKICKSLIKDYNGSVPRNREYLESLPGVGRKTANVVLVTIFNEPAFAVDTHIFRVAKILGIADEDDNILEVEEKLCNFFKKEEWGKRHLQLLFFGRYICKSKKAECLTCPFNKFCDKKKCI